MGSKCKGTWKWQWHVRRCRGSPEEEDEGRIRWGREARVSAQEEKEHRKCSPREEEGMSRRRRMKRVLVLCVQGKFACKRREKFSELENRARFLGWRRKWGPLLKGDIGELTPNGVLIIIDRKKNIFKLSQGEYVAAEYLEKVYSSTSIIEDIWVYGDSYRSMLVAVVTPHKDNTQKWAMLNGIKGSFSEICALKELHDYILHELKLAAERNKVNDFYISSGHNCGFEL
ncbi:Long chain acyl-CoA synthetase 1 [Platanthera guangdongensis]|uniref:Long chain acyl-CoA synthetase 1 n=1 Tax=Platanthera guangdongensis TaxID=2320717 RepID=A0ABR2ML45_9ASPA